jgi:hypothetical protein
MLNSTGVIIRSSVIHDATFRHGIELRTCTGALIQDVETYNCVGAACTCTAPAAAPCGGSTRTITASNYGLEMEAFGATLSDGNLVVDSWAGVTTGNAEVRLHRQAERGRRAEPLPALRGLGQRRAGAGAGFYAKGGADEDVPL